MTFGALQSTKEMLRQMMEHWHKTKETKSVIKAMKVELRNKQAAEIKGSYFEEE